MMPRVAPPPAWFIALAVVVALGAMTYRLDAVGLWTDEVYSARWTRLPLAAMLAALRGDLHPPLYFVVLKAFTRFAGDGDIALRLPGVLVGAMTVAATAWAFRPSLGARTAGLAALILALHPEFALYARMARYYAPAALVALIAHGVLARRLASRGAGEGWRGWALYAAAIAALLHTSYLAAALVAGHAAQVALVRHERPGALRAWALAVTVGAISFAPWFLSAHGQWSTVRSLLPAIVGGAKAFVAMPAYTLLAWTTSEAQLPWRGIAPLGALAAMALIALGGRALMRDRKAGAVLVPAVAGCVTSVLIVGLLARATPFVGLPARALWLGPFVAACIAVALGDATLPRRVRPVLACLVAITWLAGWANLFAGRDWVNPIYLTPGREVADSLPVGAQDLVLAEEDSAVPWYLERRRTGATLADPADSAAVERLLAEPVAGRVWLVTLARDGTLRQRPQVVLNRLRLRLLPSLSEKGYGEIPADLRAAKERVLGAPTWQWRVLVEEFARPVVTPGR